MRDAQLFQAGDNHQLLIGGGGGSGGAAISLDEQLSFGTSSENKTFVNPPIATHLDASGRFSIIVVEVIALQ